MDRVLLAGVCHVHDIKESSMSISALPSPGALIGTLLVAAAFSASHAADAPSRHGDRFYAVTPLVSDAGVAARFTDPNLKNGWGVAFNPNGFVWVADNGSAVSTLYDGDGKPQTLVVTIPGAGGAAGKPTGIVFSGSTGFAVTKNGVSGPGRFIFAGEDGTISAWAPNVDPTNAILAADNLAEHGSYKGLALAANGKGNFLFAADFHNARIDIYDAAFRRVQWPAAFVDPKLPAGYAPFGIQNLQGDIYVSYAKQDVDARDEVAGRGLGLVDVFDANGKLLRRVATGGRLNAPWGMAMAPADFGRFSNTLLVGNFGDGRISSFDARTGEFIGQLRGPDGRRIAVSGLWGMAFGNGVSNQPTGTLFFAAGPNDEVNGLYGRIEPAAGPDRAREDDDD
jgi:uncharacterized protein (TIGR03118 family)